jgi:hypothetical protein
MLLARDNPLVSVRSIRFLSPAKAGSRLYSFVTPGFASLHPGLHAFARSRGLPKMSKLREAVRDLEMRYIASLHLLAAPCPLADTFRLPFC